MSKTVLITGTSNGFGADIATTLATAGHRVFATMREMNGRHRAAAEALRAKGIHTLELDVTDNASTDAAFAELLGLTGGTLDVLVNNAGLAAGGISETFTPEQLRAMFDVNVFGVQRVLRAALPAMHAQKSGLVINIGSILGRVTIPFFGLYGATKHAVEALTDTYRYELSQLGIDVVLIQPGPYPTALYTSIQQPSDGARAAAYGDVAHLPDGIGAFLQGVFSSADAPDPRDIAREIVTLIDTPAGQRPARVVKGLGFGADGVNAAVAPFQDQLISGLGFEALNQLKTI
ncbi:SDR family oxidoreductase [Novosphingobium terrae]|uniref:SDR family oxidoreductase n=1 Tax=Novosphingobium terrae TaxID=2726189 RepID=UPI00197E4577|nr:SDR family oxidoreductase [Novosphingobium terrae]